MNNRKQVSKMSAPVRPSTDGLSAAVKQRIAEFNARPARRVGDTRVLGWSVVEA